MTQACDIAVVGAGPAGLVAACLLAASGARTVLLGPQGANSTDQRTSALFNASVRLLDHVGVLGALTPDSGVLRAIRIIDRLGRANRPSRLVFEAGEVGAKTFGLNIPNERLGQALAARFCDLASGTRDASTVMSVSPREDHVELTTDEGATIRARLVVAADGRGSICRQAAGIAARSWDYPQAALATKVRHSLPHDETSTEIHRPGGPFTTVPLAGRNAAIVWLASPHEIASAADDGPVRLAAAMSDILGGLLGDIALTAPASRFAVRGMAVGVMAARRIALVGEAAHVVPPIGAQGLNLGLRDAAWIGELASAALARGEDPGDPAVLARYRRAREGDALGRRVATDLLNRSLAAPSGPLAALRGIGLAALSGLGPMRRRLMREGMGEEAVMPAIMRLGG